MNWRDKLAWQIARVLPHRVIHWAFIRVVVKATTGVYENTIVPEITAMEALDRW